MAHQGQKNFGCEFPKGGSNAGRMNAGGKDRAFNQAGRPKSETPKNFPRTMGSERMIRRKS